MGFISIGTNRMGTIEEIARFLSVRHSVLAIGTRVRLSRFSRIVAQCSGSHGEFLLGLFQEMFNNRDHSLRLRMRSEVAGIRDDRELRIWEGLQGLGRMLNADKIVISDYD